MSGFVHTAYDTIEDLRRNLRDRYKDCYAVLKELLQNADDAGASELHIVWVESLRGAQHPLLQGPMLLIVNNGPFRFRDSFAIHLAGTGSKGHEEGKIGKFGLGLKSVFHLCEAFFYVSDPQGDNEPADDKLKEFGRTGVLNPWNPARYSAWDAFSSDDQCLVKELAISVLGADVDKWFAICLPLRKQAHCRQEVSDDPADWAIEPQYYGDSVNGDGASPPQDIFSDRRISSLRQMLPLLSTLKQVRFWSLATADGSVPKMLAQVVRDATRHLDWRTMKVGVDAIAGTIEVASNGIIASQTYAGVQQLLLHDGLLSLTARRDWPRMDSQTDSGRRRAPAAVKQHVSVVVTEHRGLGSLRVDRAVFLPLGDPPHPECRCEGECEFDLVLHGYFFVDAGRLGVDFAPEGERPTVRQEWNQILYNEGTLPLVIPALAEYARTIGDQADSKKKLRLLTSLITHQDCHLWRDQGRFICRDFVWCFRLNPSHSEWQAIPRDLPVVLLPGDDQTDTTLPFTVFPFLAEEAEKAALTFARLPRLALPNDCQLPIRLLRQMLQSVPLNQVVGDVARCDYLVRLLECLREQHSDGYLPELIQFLRRLVRSVPPSELRAISREISALMQLIPSGKTIPIPFKSDLVRESDRVFQALVEQDTEVLPVPDNFLESRLSDGRSVNTPDARVLLEALSKLRPAGAQEEAFQTLVGQTVLAVLSSWNSGTDQMLEQFGDMPLFYVKDYSSDRRIHVSVRQLKQARKAGVLFAGNASLCKKLQDSLAEGRILFVAQNEIVKLLVSALGPIPQCDAAGCASLLLREPALKSDVPSRAALLGGLLPAWTNDSKLRHALRYVLHAQGNDPGTLSLYIDGDGPWCVLVNSILVSRNEHWRVLPKVLLANVTQSQAEGLMLRSCGADTVPALISGVELGPLDLTTITRHPEWQNQIIREWPEENKEALKALPIYTSCDGTTTAITSQTFIQGDFPLPPASVFPKLILIEDPRGTIRARGLAPTLSTEDLLHTVLETAHCHRHWQFIIEGMMSDTSEALRSLLRKSPWLPGCDDVGWPPSSVICRVGLAGHVLRMREAGRRVIHRDDLPQDVVGHARWKQVEDLCPKSEELYRSLGEFIKNIPTFAVGQITVNEDSLGAFTDLFADEDGEAVMLTAALFRALREGGTGGTQWIARHMLPAVKHALTPDRAKSALKYLERRHESSTGQDRRSILEAFNRYLREAVEQTEFTDYLPELRFLNRENHWCKPSVVARSGHNVAPANVLHQAHADAMGDSCTSTKHQHDESVSNRNFIAGRHFDSAALAASAGILGSFLETWRSDDIPDDALAAVVAMLGNHDGFPQLYERLRDARLLKAMRSLFPWHIVGTAWGLRELMDKQHFCILPADAKTVIAVNLLGETFNAAVSTRLDSLFDGFDGRTYFPIPIDERCYLIRLRQIDPEPLSSQEKLAILGNTVQAVRLLIHRQGDEDFQAIWNQITHVGQLDIEIAQEMILESSAMLLETQLSIRKSTKLRKLFNDWHQVRQRAKTATAENERREADADRRQVLESLRSILLTDTATQRLLVSEIRSRLEAASYEAMSIPFELFQNGDDAVVELETLCADHELIERARPAELRHRFVAVVDSIKGAAVIRFAHWGRGINQFRIGAADGKDSGFDRDMERMLVLQGSGKDDADDSKHRTGKFGLGFKSVFFVCDSPCVLSGSRSRFRVLAGVYPDRLADKDEKRLEQVLENEGDAAHKGTVVELALRQPTDADAALGRFRELSAYLVVFARRIRECSISESNRSGFARQWKPETIIPGIEAGEIQVGVGSSQSALVFRFGRDGYGAVLVPLVASGVCPDSLKNVPEVWVTTPTRHEGAGTMLVNGPFDLNPGRTQLRKTVGNLNLANEMGQALGEQLMQLHQQFREEWSDLRNRIGCHQASWEGFWSSFWNASIPYAETTSANDVLHGILFGSEHCGMYRLIREADALPTGLPATFAGLTSLSKVRWQTGGILAESDTWLLATSCSWLRQQVVPGTILAQSVAHVLKQFCQIDVRILSVKSIVDGTLTDVPCVEPGIAAELGVLVSPKRLQLMGSDRRYQREADELTDLLSTLKFRTASGGWGDAAKLLVPHSADIDRREETRRATFAPADRLLDETYTDVALAFFLSCRGDMKATAKEMATWILQATDLGKRRSGLEYLEQGEQSPRVKDELNALKPNYPHCWLDDAEALKQSLPEDPNRQAVIMGKLEKGEQYAQQHAGSSPTPPGPIPPSRAPAAILADLFEWWRSDRDAILACHDRSIYPQRRLPQVNFSASTAQLNSDVAVRKEWLILLMLGTMHRIGRASRHQHRGFLEMCEERSWLDVLAGRIEDSSSWFRIMDDFLDSLQGGAAYFHWMNQFLAYYQLARWLPNYARAFSAVTRPGVNLADLRSIRDIADLRTSHIFSGSTGFDAPPCSRTLGLGSHFVLREAIRIRAAAQTESFRISPKLEQLAYVPALGTRRLLAQILLGGDSSDKAAANTLLREDTTREGAAKTIALALRTHLNANATFDGALDIPLLVLNWPQYRSTLTEILGQEAPALEASALDFLSDTDEPEEEPE